MKLIHNNKDLEETLIRLICDYENMSFAVAWASAGTKVFDTIIDNEERITKAVIGTHFYQTDPDVLKKFIGSEKVKFVMNTAGVFHPKVFVFWDSLRWEILIGSANLTKGALSGNVELMVLVSEHDQRDSDLKVRVIEQIIEYGKSSITMDSETALSYESLSKKYRANRMRLAGEYGRQKKKRQSRAPVDTKIMPMSWENFADAVKTRESDLRLVERIGLLKTVHAKFLAGLPLASMDLGARKTIAGLPNSWQPQWAWFGNMQGDGNYHSAVNANNIHISNALDCVPLHAPVELKHFNDFIVEFSKAFADGRRRVSAASRLLAMKRPDYFVCVAKKNLSLLCKDFGIAQTDMTYERYWEEIICRITGSVWWDSSSPLVGIDRDIWDNRAALLDSIYYQE